MKIKNNKAQIATAMLVIIALGMSAAALFTMITFNSNYVLGSAEIERITSELNFKENYQIIQAEKFGRYLVDECSECVNEELIEKAREFEERYRITTESDGLIFAKIRNGDFSFEKKEKNYILKIKGLRIQSSSGKNVLIRVIDICFVFDEDKNVVDCTEEITDENLGEELEGQLSNTPN